MRSIHLAAIQLLTLMTLQVNAFVHPIEIFGKFFVDSITKQPFYLKGLDYQPGGAAAVNSKEDVLSNPQKCARDILLMQDLGVNTIRVYSVNPDLDHDVCMTMMASAGIYLVLDVNSPLPGQHLNRYEPWTTYTTSYLEHVFKVVDVFSKYNNTLAFFAGNEVVNDKRSARNSPPYVKQLISDMKQYMSKHSPRTVPVGYSAADDLDYRVSLSKYLECEHEDFPNGSVDFYGVNTYQWCGHQTFETSGYDKLTKAYHDYTKPVFFSEFGCNEVKPRQFEEIDAMFSSLMFTTFSGGLVYEYSLEPNNYGIVKIDESKKSITLLDDYKTLKAMYHKVQVPTPEQVARELSNSDNPNFFKKIQKPSACESEYKNIEITKEPSSAMGKEFIVHGMDLKHNPTFLDLSDDDLAVKEYTIYDVDGKTEYIRQANMIVSKTVDVSEITDFELERINYNKEKSASMYIIEDLD